MKASTLLLSTLATLAFTSASYAKRVAVCNQTKLPVIHTAVGYKDLNSFGKIVTKGWYKIPTGRCVVIYNKAPKTLSNTFYFHGATKFRARDNTQKIAAFEGKVPLCINGSKDFTLTQTPQQARRCPRGTFAVKFGEFKVLPKYDREDMIINLIKPTIYNTRPTRNRNSLNSSDIYINGN